MAGAYGKYPLFPDATTSIVTVSCPVAAVPHLSQLLVLLSADATDKEMLHPWMSRQYRPLQNGRGLVAAAASLPAFASFQRLATE
ncbi:hypothetical protein C444_06876 [Haloarcula japonica DSM 6131]|uniref:Uncharacterized protein n=1 Tax=Haloarcula japonica (strain ATCC 49778 / DSM 6131 / JCM 7785 / NBRC 101032 / NCIMB 13157 / TR-1) TaxID=1227453 RepID=M0LHC2_HALJT|nr:hypothetical protein C444_06876 [Haloarcula japonica DSM 6131]